MLKVVLEDVIQEVHYLLSMFAQFRIPLTDSRQKMFDQNLALFYDMKTFYLITVFAQSIISIDSHPKRKHI